MPVPLDVSGISARSDVGKVKLTLVLLVLSVTVPEDDPKEYVILYSREDIP